MSDQPQAEASDASRPVDAVCPNCDGGMRWRYGRLRCDYCGRIADSVPETVGQLRARAEAAEAEVKRLRAEWDAAVERGRLSTAVAEAAERHADAGHDAEEHEAFVQLRVALAAYRAARPPAPAEGTTDKNA